MDLLVDPVRLARINIIVSRVEAGCNWLKAFILARDREKSPVVVI